MSLDGAALNGIRLVLDDIRLHMIKLTRQVDTLNQAMSRLADALSKEAP